MSRKFVIASRASWMFCIWAASCGSPAPAPAPAAVPAPPPPPAMPAVAVYVTNEASGDMTVIDAAAQSAVRTIALGKRPRGLKVSPDHTRLTSLDLARAGPGVMKRPSAGRQSAGSIGVFDLAENKLLKVLPSGSIPKRWP